MYSSEKKYSYLCIELFLMLKLLIPIVLWRVI